MAIQSGINLIRTKTSSSPQLEAIERSLRRTAYVSIIAFLSIGVIVGVTYFLFTAEKSRLDNSKQQLEQQITGNATKEAMYVAIKSRVRIVGSAIQNQKPWGRLLDRVTLFITPPALTDISVDNQNRVSISVETTSLEQLAGVVRALTDSVKANQVVNPQLVSFQIGNSGAIQSTFSFLAVF